MSDFPAIYLHFSKAVHKINRRYKINDPKELLVIEAVLDAHIEGVKFAVLDLILLKEIASQATLHSVMMGLILKKIIKTEVCQRDARRKYVLPTKHCLDWLKDCSELLATIDH